MLRLYLRYFGIHIRSQMQYKTSFIISFFGQFLIAFNVFLGVYFMFSRFKSVEGFTFNQVLLCFAVMLTSFSLAEFFFRGFDSFSSTISGGEFDRILVRPRGAVFQVLCSKLDLTRLSRATQATLVFCYAIPTSGVHWSIDRIFTLCLMLIGGTLLFSLLFLVYASLCFFTTESLEFMNILTDGGREFGTYPFAIYGRGVLTFLTFVVPLACIQYYPLMYLIGQSDSILYMLAPLSSFLFAVPCYFLWTFGLKHYKSTGS